MSEFRIIIEMNEPLAISEWELLEWVKGGRDVSMRWGSKLNIMAIASVTIFRPKPEQPHYSIVPLHHLATHCHRARDICVRTYVE